MTQHSPTRHSTAQHDTSRQDVRFSIRGLPIWVNVSRRSSPAKIPHAAVKAASRRRSRASAPADCESKTLRGVPQNTRWAAPHTRTRAPCYASHFQQEEPVLIRKHQARHSAGTEERISRCFLLYSSGEFEYGENALDVSRISEILRTRKQNVPLRRLKWGGASSSRRMF